MRSRYHQAIDLNSLPTKTARQKENAMMENETMKCPVCAEEINAEAVKCRFCGEMLNNSPEISRPTTIPRQSESRRTGRFLLVGLLSILLPGASWCVCAVTPEESAAEGIAWGILCLSTAFSCAIGTYYLVTGKKNGRALVTAGLAIVAFLLSYFGVAVLVYGE